MDQLLPLSCERLKDKEELFGSGYVVKKKNSKKRYPDVRARDFVFLKEIMSVLFPFSLCVRFHSEVTTTAHHMQTNTGSYSKSREGALYLRRAVRVNLKP